MSEFVTITLLRPKMENMNIDFLEAALNENVCFIGKGHYPTEREKLQAQLDEVNESEWALELVAYHLCELALAMKNTHAYLSSAKLDKEKFDSLFWLAENQLKEFKERPSPPAKEEE